MNMTKQEFRKLFNRMMLYYPNQYQNMNKDDLSELIGIYYNSLKKYDFKVMEIRLQKYFETERYFPKICDLIPTESDYMDLRK